jgi:acetyltransferase-like isoleucine patch superfamily enzyme
MEVAYRSRMGRVLSRLARTAMLYSQPRMLYGYHDPATGLFRKFTRMSSNVVIQSPKSLAIGDHVWVGHHSILDASEGLTIGEGVQIGAWCGVFTHGSETSIRLLGSHFVSTPRKSRAGYTRGAVTIGDYTFIGAGSVVLAGVTIGKGCVIAPLSMVARSIPDYSIASGNPARIVGDTRRVDAPILRTADFSQTYYDAELLAEIATEQGADFPNDSATSRTDEESEESKTHKE